MANARVDATLSLQLISILGTNQASLLSRRRRLWKSAVSEPKRDEMSNLEPWVEVALAADYDQASKIVFKPEAIAANLIKSPSDTIPLLKVAESRCETALFDIWIELFVAIVKATRLGSSKPTSPTTEKAPTITVADRSQLSAPN